MVQMNLCTRQKQSHRYRKQTYGYKGKEERVWHELGDYD